MESQPRLVEVRGIPPFAEWAKDGHRELSVGREPKEGWAVRQVQEKVWTRYLNVAGPSISSSRWAVKSIMDPNAGPESGLVFKVSTMAASTLSRPSGLDAM